jgi:hypothetical protein
MIHYHGTPITPRSELERLSGKHFCVSYADPRDTGWCLENAQSVMLDNGAFSAYTRGVELDQKGYMDWLDDKLYGSNWAVVPDVIGGSVVEQRDLMLNWRYPDHLSCYVWHMDLPLDWLEELVYSFPRIAFGSSGKYWKVGSKEWQDRADEAWEVLDKTNTRPWVHMMRGLRVAGKRWPFASADSTNVARNHKGSKRQKRKCPLEMINRIDSVQCPMRFEYEYYELNAKGAENGVRED